LALGRLRFIPQPTERIYGGIWTVNGIKNNKKDYSGVIFPTLLMGAELAYFIEVMGKTNPRFPYDGMLIKVLVLLSVPFYILIMIEEVRKLKSREEGSKKPLFTERQRFLLFATILYVPCEKYLGFLPATMMYLFVCITRLGNQKPASRLLISAGLTAVLYLAFHTGLKLDLPMGFLEGLL